MTSVSRAPSRKSNRSASTKITRFTTTQSRAPTRLTSRSLASLAKSLKDTHVSRPNQSKPKAKAKSPKKKSKHLFDLDPRSDVRIPTVLSAGFANPFSGLVRSTGNTITAGTTHMLVCVSNTGHSATCGSWIRADNLVVTSGVFSIPALSALPAAGGPVSGRAEKASFRIIPHTPALDRGSSIHVLSTSQRLMLEALPSVMTAPQFHAARQIISTHPKTRALDAADLGQHGDLTVNFPLDQAPYETFDPWVGVDTPDGFFAHVASNVALPPGDHPMSATWVMISPGAKDATYEFELRASYYTRWPLTSAMGQQNRPIPTGPPDKINVERNVMEGLAEKVQGMGQYILSDDSSAMANVVSQLYTAFRPYAPPGDVVAQHAARAVMQWL